MFRYLLRELFGQSSRAVKLTSADGTVAWYRGGKLHRDDGPATVNAAGSKEWWRDGQLHRDDGPAIELADGSKAWWRDGKLVDPAIPAAKPRQFTP